MTQFFSHMLLAAFSVLPVCLGETEYSELSPQRIAAIESMLPSVPRGFGMPISDRDFWSSPATLAKTNRVRGRAEPLLSQSFPAWNDGLYLDYSKTGQRPAGESMIRARAAWLAPLVTAECVENKGRFLPAINLALNEYVKQPCWTIPAHDAQMENFHRRKFTVDLHGAAFAADLAQALYLLEDRIPVELREKVSTALKQRVFDPVRRSLETGEGHWWLGNKADSVKNNWNSVCLAGVVGAARTILSNRHDRAVFLAAGEHYSQYFINSFTDDGYCEEGPGYWIYGFGSLVALREITADSTGGRVDLFDHPKTRLMALFGDRITFPGGGVPPFADCREGTMMDTGLTDFCRRVFGFRTAPGRAESPAAFQSLAWQFATETPGLKRIDSSALDSSERSYFDKVGVLVCRPGRNTANRFSAAIKAGGNGSHSHNDVGSFVISLDGSQPVGDPGGPHAYDSQTFGPNRFQRRILNSFGHPVPVVDGQLQVDATTIKPRVIENNFGDAMDRILIDLKPAYKSPTLRHLTRCMTYSRSNSGEVSIEDHVVFSKPSRFETALSSRWKMEQTGPSTLQFTDGDKKLLVEITTPAGFDVTTEEIREMGAPAFTRIGLKLRKPVTNATVRMSFRSPR